MDTREALVQLPSYLVGDLSPKEAAILEGHLDVNPEAKEAKEKMARQLTPLINLQAPEVGEVALNQLFAKAKVEIPKLEPQPVRDFFYMVAQPSVARFIARAAAVVIAAVAITMIAGKVLSPDSSIVGQMMALDGRVMQIREGETVEARQGTPLTLRLPEGTVQLDGSSSVRVRRSAGASAVEIQRGRVIVDAATRGMTVSLQTHTFNVEARSVGAFELDTAYEKIQGGGTVIELQRQPLSRVARIGEDLYGVNLNTSRLPAEVANRRISIYGAGLGQKEFISSFKNAAQRYGVVFNAADKGFDLAYQAGAAADEMDQQESVLSVASVQGVVSYSRGTLANVTLKLESEKGNFARIIDGEALPAHRDDMVQHMVVWATRNDLGGNFKANDSVKNFGKVYTVGGALPVGSVISSDHLQVPVTGGEPRIYKLGGSEYNYPVGGGKFGKVVSLTSGGVELEVKGETGRVYMPLK
ncbi:MAG: hypothetical protein IT462_12955 [Planctomycetes bacterium]|nr:hypothetical protein [Planctomycetota bacterium]